MQRPVLDLDLDAAALTARLVDLPSVSGSEKPLADAVEEALRTLPWLRVDRYGNNVVARTELGRAERVVLAGHIDTVPGEIPVRVQDGALWGRGSVDAKGALVAAYCAARRFRYHPDVRVRIVGAVDEEGLSRGVAALSRDLDPEWILVGEPSGVAGMGVCEREVPSGWK
jgi:succinyl-diaminopimelate desuccinylase